MADVTWDDAALTDLLESPDGPVGQYLAELSETAATIARAKAPIRRGRGGSTAAPVGATIASIRPVLGVGAHGLYGGVNAAADPTVFLETPAAQMERAYPFLTTALWAVINSVDTGADSWVWDGIAADRSPEGGWNSRAG